MNHIDRGKRRSAWKPTRGLLAIGCMALAAASCSDSVTGPSAAGPASLDIWTHWIVVESLQETIELPVRVLDADGAELSGIPLEWEIESEGVLEALGDGHFRSLANGEAQVRVRVASHDPANARAPHGAGPLERWVRVVVQQQPRRLALVADPTPDGSPQVFQLWSLGQQKSLPVWSVDANGHRVAPVAGEIDFRTDTGTAALLGANGQLTASQDGEIRVHARALGLEGEVTVVVNAALSLESCAVYAEEEGAGESAESCGTRGIVFSEWED